MLVPDFKAPVQRRSNEQLFSCTEPCAVLFVDNPPVLHEEQTGRLQLEEKAA